MGGFAPPLASTTMAFSPLAAITAPSPPHALIREGTRSLSAFWIPAALRRISAPGRINATGTFKPKRS